MRRHRMLASVVGILALVGASAAWATDVPVAGVKLILVDKLYAGTAKGVFVAKDLNVTKGLGTDVDAISAVVKMAQAAEIARWIAMNPPGINPPPIGDFLVNKDTVAKYVNKAAPSGGGVKVTVIKPGKLLKAVFKNLGDGPSIGGTQIPIVVDPGTGLIIAFSVSNGAETFNHCTTFEAGTCVIKDIGGGAGAKLVCKGGTPSGCPSSPSGAFVD